MAYANQIQLGSLTLGGSGNNVINDIRAAEVPGTYKEVHNGTLIETPLPGMGLQWEITITGKLTGSTRDTDYGTLRGYNDGTPRRYDDGRRAGMDMCIRTGSLVFADNSDRPTEYPFTMTLIEFDQ